MKTITSIRLVHVAVLTFGLLACGAGNIQADGQNHGARGKIAVTGNFDWSIIPANLGPHIIPGMDGDLHLRHLPLAGRFTLNGKGVALEAKIHVDLNGELDATGTGVVWGDGAITTTVNGVKTIIFEGNGTANEVNLVGVGQMSFNGRGPYEGSRLELTFEEIGPGNSDTYTLKGFLSPAPRR